MLNQRLQMRGQIPGWLTYAIVLFILAVFTIMLQVRWSPANQKIHVDGTFYAYGGQRILEGDLPYRDFWDPKPPGVFYLNALAFSLWGADAWGVWYLTVLWNLGIAFSVLWLLRKFLPLRYAFLGSAVLLATLLQSEFYEGSNLIEFYGVLPAILAIGFTFLYLKHGRRLSLLGLGAAFAFGLLLKHTGIATASACIGVVLFLDFRHGGLKVLGRTLFLIAAPIILPLATLSTYFWTQGALGDLWDANIKFAILYSEGFWGLRNVYGAFRKIATKSTLAPLLTLAAGAAIAHVSFRRQWFAHDPEHAASHRPPAEEWTYVAVFLALFLEVLFLSLLGSRFDHYYMAGFPSLVIAAFYWFRLSTPVRNTPKNLTFLSSIALSIGWGAIAIWFLLIFGLIRPSGYSISEFLADAPRRHPLRTSVGKYVDTETEPEDTVLVWGLGAEVNFETNRKFPTRYVFFTELFQANIPGKERWDDFMSGLEENRPALIITKWMSGFAPMLDLPEDELASACQCDGEILEGFTALTEFVRTNYDRELILEDSFAAYHLRAP